MVRMMLVVVSINCQLDTPLNHLGVSLKIICIRLAFEHACHWGLVKLTDEAAHCGRHHSLSSSRS